MALLTKHQRTGNSSGLAFLGEATLPVADSDKEGTPKGHHVHTDVHQDFDSGWPLSQMISV